MTRAERPILTDIPEQLETERLLLRAPRIGDGAMVNAAIRESHVELSQWMPWAVPLPTPDDTEAELRRLAAAFIRREDLMLLALNRTTGEFVGSSGLHHIDWSVPRFEIGYWVRTSLVGRGYMTEAVKGIAQFAFDKLRAERIEIRCDALNHRSAAVAERAGFTLEARLQHEARAVDGSLRDTLIFARIRDAS